MIPPAGPLSTLRCDPSRNHRQDSRPEWSRFSFSGRALSSPRMCRFVSALSVPFPVSNPHPACKVGQMPCQRRVCYGAGPPIGAFLLWTQPTVRADLSKHWKVGALQLPRTIALETSASEIVLLPITLLEPHVCLIACYAAPPQSGHVNRFIPSASVVHSTRQYGHRIARPSVTSLSAVVRGHHSATKPLRAPRTAPSYSGPKVHNRFGTCQTNINRPTRSRSTSAPLARQSLDTNLHPDFNRTVE